MYLKRITVTGFKSFASKTTLDLEPGISAIVGPNGSGKSNLADAVRWALGEQSKGRLRLNDREEVVFAGTERRAKASYADVTLLFNNEDGAFPLDLTEVEISRRLYRSGETDYRLGGKNVRLSDIQALLAEAGFGAGTYAVIGQGMIDSFLMSSPAERKLLFEEAAGIRASELKREASLRKLAATETNLTRLHDIVGELEPRLATLQRSVAAGEELRRLEGALADLRQQYASSATADLDGRRIELIRTSDEGKLTLHRVRHELREVERTQQSRLAEAAKLEAAEQDVRQAHDHLEEEREAASLKLGDLRGRLLQLEEHGQQAVELATTLAGVNGELESAEHRFNELSEQLHHNQATADKAARALARAGQDVAAAQTKLVALRQETADGTQQQYVGHALEIMKSVAHELERPEVAYDQVKLLVHKAGRLLSHASKAGEAELLAKLRDAQGHLEVAMTHRETATEHQTNLTINSRSLEIDLAHQEETVSRLKASAADLTKRHAEASAEAAEVGEIRGQITTAEAALTKLKDQITAQRQKLQLHRESTTAAVVAEEAARVERLRSEETEAERTFALAAEALKELASSRRELAERLKGWGVRPESTLTVGDIAQIEREMGRLEAEVDVRRTANEASASEYAEVTGRHGEMITQIADLEQARLDLGQIVTQLDAVIRLRFKENFASLAEHFSTYFTRLFDGGSASLVLEEGEAGEYGIQIKASPKGKRLASLSALSGGERALAGVALLAAILRVNPSPFVVLDEIDAALDEANSGRLADIMTELARHSQLIVITHNRQTMTVARVLFGVTMNDQHVSHLLSLHLEEATQLAAR